MYLAGERQRIDDPAEVVDRGKVDESDHARVGIDLDLADVAAVGKGGGFRREGTAADEGAAVALAGRRGNAEEVGRAVCAGHGEAPIGKLDVARRRLEKFGRDRLGLVDQVVGGDQYGAAAVHDGARPARAVAARGIVGVALANVDGVERDAQSIDENLGEWRFVALAARLRADHGGEAVVLFEA